MIRTDAGMPRRRQGGRREVLHGRRTSCTSAGCTTSRSRWKGRSSSRKSATSTPKGYPAAEMKHGPIALVDEDTPSVFVVPRGKIYPKVMSNMEEIKARRGPIIAIACEGDDKIAELADDVIYVPDVDEYLQPLVTSIPLQLLAYHIAVLARLQRRPPAESREERDGGVVPVESTDTELIRPRRFSTNSVAREFLSGYCRYRIPAFNVPA